ncbi:4'-phosphopantetheinyl transferase superfamily protein [Endozoicomonas sp.]|nr:4'-phosphopantetheinyl transferase superfamily protein [Endozoicomonas sp.]
MINQKKTDVSDHSTYHLCSNCQYANDKIFYALNDLPESLALTSFCYESAPSSIYFFQSEGLSLPSNLTTARTKRQAEYLAGRYCAGIGLKRLGADNFEVKASRDRSPVWPENYTGSISHSQGFAMAVTGEKARYRSIGVDIEKIVSESRAERLSNTVLTDSDCELRSTLGLPIHWFFTLVFSAKESLYKLLHPELKRSMGFESACLSLLNTEQKTFTLTLTSGLSAEWQEGSHFTGNYFEIDGYLVTVLYLNASDASQ